MASISLLDVRSLVLLLRFNTSLVFFNANCLRQQVERATEHAGDGLHWLVLDAMPITQMAVIGYFVDEKLKAPLRQKGVQLAVAGQARPSVAFAANRNSELN